MFSPELFGETTSIPQDGLGSGYSEPEAVPQLYSWLAPELRLSTHSLPFVSSLTLPTHQKIQRHL